MTVRWKPLFILSGLFFVVAVLGVIAMAWTLVPKSAQGVLKQARAAAAAGRFENAEIHFEQALQFEAKNASIHEEFAKLAQATGDDRGRDEALHEGRFASLAPGADMIDRIARVRLEALDIQCQVQIQRQSETARLGDQVKSLLAHVKELTAIPDVDPG